MLSANDEGKTATKDLNDKSTTVNYHDHQVMSSLSVTKLPTTSEVIAKDQSIFRFVSSDVDNNDIYGEDSNAIINKLIFISN